MHYDSHLTKKFKKSAVCFHDTKIITIFTIKGFPVKGKYIKIYLRVHAFEILYFLKWNLPVTISTNKTHLLIN